MKSDSVHGCFIQDYILSAESVIIFQSRSNNQSVLELYMYAIQTGFCRGFCCLIPSGRRSVWKRNKSQCNNAYIVNCESDHLRVWDPSARKGFLPQPVHDARGVVCLGLLFCFSLVVGFCSVVHQLHRCNYYESKHVSSVCRRFVFIENPEAFMLHRQ